MLKESRVSCAQLLAGPLILLVLRHCSWQAKLAKVKSELRRVTKETEREEQKLQAVTTQSEQQSNDYEKKVNN